MQKDIVLQGKFKVYFNLMTYMSVFWAGLVVLLAFFDVKASVLAGLFWVVYLVVNILVYKALSKRLAGDLVEFALRFDQIEENMLEEFIVPSALLDNRGNILWVNDPFTKTCEVSKDYYRHITTLFPEITESDFPSEDGYSERELIYIDKFYKIVMQRVGIGYMSGRQNVVKTDEDSYMIALYMFDVNEKHELLRTSEENKLVVGFISIDNYDETVENLDDVKRSLLFALIERRISKFFTEYDGFYKKYDSDKYFYVVKKTSYEAIKKARFSLLEEVKSVSIGNEVPVTISMSAALNQETFAKTSNAAMVGIDLALGRGGDQVVIKDGDKTMFFGGRTESMEKATRVKARVKAQALREFIIAREKVIIMGHKITDVDSLGAALGIYCAARAMNRPAHVVIDENSVSIRPIVDELKNNPDYEPTIFINKEEAMRVINRSTLLVIVDTNRPSYTECPELLKKTETIVVLDHHRQGEEFIKEASLSYVEPYASSACEMVAEVLQYFEENIRIGSLVAGAMYSGILVDTNNFSTRTGVRTFEAAAFLKRKGADITRVRKQFRESIDDCRVKARAISDSELFLGCYAIAECPPEGERPTVLGAQVANELLNVEAVRASFVLTEFGNKIYISARAIDEVNVQFIMERLGGGGHINIAGAQFEDLSLAEVKTILKKTISQMTEEGDI